MRLGGPALHGVVFGYGLLFLVLAPTIFWGPLPEFLFHHRTHLLMPALTLLLLPGAAAGYLATRLYPDRRSVGRFIGGLFLGSCLAAALLYARGADYGAPAAALLLVLIGHPLLAGLWTFLGALLGAAAGYVGSESTEAGTGQREGPSKP